MSTGIIICSICHRELHQQSDRSWYHCEDATPECKPGQHEYAGKLSRIKGKWCGADRYDET